jgi:hypothetical protein
MIAEAERIAVGTDREVAVSTTGGEDEDEQRGAHAATLSGVGNRRHHRAHRHLRKAGVVVSVMPKLAVLLCLLAASTAARAEPPSPHLIYVEVLGKGGAYGIGYEYTLMRWLAVGGAGSFAVVGDQQITTAAPYIHTTLLGQREHRLFGELGAILAHSRIPSPVTDWKGMSNTGTGGFLSLGYEHATRHVVLRASGSIVAGDGGVGPMVGLSIGARP